MFTKQDNEAMVQAARNQRKQAPMAQDDMTAYDNIQPGHSAEPMTEDNIKFNYTQVPGSEVTREQMQGQFVPNGQIDPNIMPPRPEMPEGSEDEALFPNGPTIAEFMAWQKQFSDIYVVDDLPDEIIYVYRTITRYEYKVLQALPNTDPLQREELLLDKCLLWPIVTYEDMSNMMAGIISVLAQHILTSSGFIKDSVPRKL